MQDVFTDRFLFSNGTDIIVSWNQGRESRSFIVVRVRFALRSVGFRLPERPNPNPFEFEFGSLIERDPRKAAINNQIRWLLTIESGIRRASLSGKASTMSAFSAVSNSVFQSSSDSVR